MASDDCCPEGEWCQDCGHGCQECGEAECDCDAAGWCWACGEDGCDGECEPETVLRPVVDEPAFARLGLL